MTTEFWTILLTLGIPVLTGLVTMLYVGARGIEAIHGLKRSVDDLRKFLKELDDKVDVHSERLATLEAGKN